MRRVLFLLVLLVAKNAVAQFPLSMSGRSFSFGIIEGAENQDGGPGNLSKGITLTVLGPVSGTGSIISPCGYATSFSFSAMKPTILILPDSLIHLKDDGKTKKGLLVTTSEPISLVLHDALLDAGDATQIYPDASLDTDYYCPSWGLWNDLNESNHSETLVTASANNTQVTITPSVMTLVGDSANKPINVTLDAGECYMIKCDTSHGGASKGLSGTTVLSSKPVSVIVGTTCAYIPLAQESCNELMDEIRGRSHWSDHYYISPLGNADTSGNIRAILTSDSLAPFLFSVNGAQEMCYNGRVELTFTGAASINTFGVKCDLHELAEGSNLAGFTGMSDPTMVTVLDSTSWSDTLVWQTLPLQNGKHYISLLYPAWKQHEIMLDGRSLDSLKPPQSLIEGSAVRSFVIPIDSGVHTVTSPVPIFGIATGWAVADGYSFLPGTFSTIPQRSVRGAIPSVTRVAITPNPSTDHVSIDVSASLATDADVSIVNMLGERVAHLFRGRLEGERSFEWRSPNAGVFECVVKTATAQTATRLIIQR